ncbi:MAG TPA: iron ABC transporter permease [Candidatus Baltobacteraceae bacterium]|jgi:iron complex transport system permease protein|nr:iron ABC transporter permease [Candidatus Baltobacteraceae bacterium]
MALRLAALAFAVVAAMGASLLVGGAPIAPHVVFGAAFHPLTGSDVATIVWQLRIPRICIAAAVGIALAIAGALLQGMLRNPLVDPYLTGVSAGAAAAIALATLAGIATPLLPALGFVTGLGTAVLVAALARRGSGIDANRLILAGISLSALFSAIVAFAIARAQSADYAQQILAWLAGSLASRTWRDLAFTAPYLALGLGLSAFAVPALNALRVGDTRARSVGVDVARAQWIILAASSLLAAASVALAGIIGFVGLIVPHVARRIVGSDARMLLPASALCGAALTIAADAVARTIVAPSELPIGVLLAFIGVPAFLYLYLRLEQRA